MKKKQRKNFKRVTRGQLEQQKWLIHGQEQMIEELLKRVSELEARPTFPYYPTWAPLAPSPALRAVAW